jgi:hypothetical protein
MALLGGLVSSLGGAVNRLRGGAMANVLARRDASTAVNTNQRIGEQNRANFVDARADEAMQARRTQTQPQTNMLPHQMMKTINTSSAQMGGQTVRPLQPMNQGQQVPIQQQAMQPQAAQPQFGLAGAEQALTGGMAGAGQALDKASLAAFRTLGQDFGGFQGSQVEGDFGSFRPSSVRGNFGVTAGRIDPMTGQPMFSQAAEGVDRFSGAGVAAQQQQAALSGALGADAQRAAMQGFMESPAQQFLREQGELGIINQASALGGLGGGNVQRELARFGTGLAAQDFQNQFNRLGSLSDQGLRAAGQAGQFLAQAGAQQGNLAAQQAQLQQQASAASAANRLSAAQSTAQLAQQAGLQNQANQLAQAQANAQMAQQAGLQGQANQFAAAQQQAQLQNQLGINAANLFQGTGRDLAQGRLQAGRDIATQIGQATSALGNLAQQQGSGISDLIGQGGSNVANLLSGAGQAMSDADIQRALALANLAVGEGSQIASARQGIGQAQAGGIQGGADAIAGTTMDIAKMATMMSDKRLKKDINKLGNINGINIYEWAWNGLLGLSGKAVGVIAQEVEKIIPNSVVETNTGYKAVRYDIVKEFINA